MAYHQAGFHQHISKLVILESFILSFFEESTSIKRLYRRFIVLDLNPSPYFGGYQHVSELVTIDFSILSAIKLTCSIDWFIFIDFPVVARLQGEEPSDWNAELRRKFLRRLTLALVTYGSSAPRTEYLIQSAADRLHVKVDIAVLSSLVILLFPHATDKFK